MDRRDAKDCLKSYDDAKALRAHHEPDWRKASAYCMPREYARWQTSGPPTITSSAEAVRRVVFDSTGQRSLKKYVAILERLATPVGQRWHGLQPTNADLRRIPAVTRYFDATRDILFKARYHPAAAFRTATSEMYESMGAYGNGPMFIGKRSATPLRPQAGFKYVACPMRDMFFLTDDDGNVVAIFRRFYLNVRMFKTKFKDEPLPPMLQKEDAKSPPRENEYFEFVHYVYLRDESEYKADAIDARRHPVGSSYIAVADKVYVGREDGFSGMPYVIPRTRTVAGDPYGHAPAVECLAALGGASQTKKTVLKQGNKAVDPALLVYDDGVLNGTVDQRPGHSNPGGVNKDGRPLVHAVPTGNFKVSEMLLADDRRDVEDSFFVTLFQILTETPEMTATEVMERVAEKASLLSPTMGRLQTEFLGPDIEREIHIAAELGMLPEMPPELVEAKGDYEVTYTSPMAKGMYAEDTAGFMRTLELALNVAERTQSPDPLDHFNFDVALPEIADYNSTPSRWMNDPKVVEAKRQERKEQTEQAQLLQNASGLANAATAMNGMAQEKAGTP